MVIRGLLVRAARVLAVGGLAVASVVTVSAAVSAAGAGGPPGPGRR
ncbi:MAG TPA: hypothetical protein VGM53_28570 [Streptosporangiaceae bacterium]|jgi:hypothetical protein